MATKLCLLALLVIFSCVKGQLYDLEFNENGKTYKELITVDNQLKIVVYDVPKHGSRGAATYLKDFINRWTVMRDNEANKCYAWKMEKDEPTPDAVVNGLKKNNFKFPASRFWIINENLLPIRDFDSSGVPHIAKFCDTMEFKEVELFNDTKEMEKIVKERLVAKFNSNNGGRTKRTVDFTEFPACDRANFNEVMRCYKAGKPQLITLTCRILLSPHCSYKVSCKTVIQNNNNRYQCPDPVHSMTQIHCCKPKCSV